MLSSEQIGLGLGVVRGSSLNKFGLKMLGIISDIEQLHVVGGAEDLPANTNGKPADNNSLVVCFGELLIDFVPTVGGVSLAEAPALKKAPGGAPANVAVGISRLGGSSAFIGKVNSNIHLYSVPITRIIL